MSDLDQIVSAVIASKKYGTVCVDTVRRIAEHELARSKGNLRAATKATKRRLHQVYGAFEQGLDYDDAYRHLEAAYRAGSDAEIKTTCRRILGLHSSTRERLTIVDGFYQVIFGLTGRPGSILDLGCGLNPLAVPWMGLSPGTRYFALDIDVDRVLFLNRYLVLAGLEPLARCQDILTHAPGEEADLALLLKMSPSLERQEPGATLHLLDRLRTSFVAVSFAVKSLTGREKGMSDHYRRQFLELAGTRTWTVEKLAFETELVFVVGK
jgi:16S rRNA (guanine(1405)-N(7))-methyltransferase